MMAQVKVGDQRKSTEQQGVAEEHGLDEADHCDSRRSTEGSHCDYVCPHCHRFPLEDYIWSLRSTVMAARTRRSNAIGSGRRVGQ